MKHAPGVSVLGSIAYRGDHHRVFRCADIAQYATGRGCADPRRTCQPGGDCQTAETAVGKIASHQNSATAAGRPPGTGCGTRAGAPAATLVGAETKTKTKAQGQEEAASKAKGCTKAAGPTRKRGPKAEAETQEAG